MLLRACYVVCGTELAYGATPCYGTERMVLWLQVGRSIARACLLTLEREGSEERKESEEREAVSYTHLRAHETEADL
eukprot:1737500-Rhodomonas_salina.2